MTSQIRNVYNSCTHNTFLFNISRSLRVVANTPLIMLHGIARSIKVFWGMKKLQIFAIQISNFRRLLIQVHIKHLYRVPEGMTAPFLAAGRFRRVFFIGWPVSKFGGIICSAWTSCISSSSWCSILVRFFQQSNIFVEEFGFEGIRGRAAIEYSPISEYSLWLCG